MPQLSSLSRPFAAGFDSATRSRPAPGFHRLTLAWWSGWVGATSVLGRDGIR